jgi:hypothetical protein
MLDLANGQAKTLPESSSIWLGPASPKVTKSLIRPTPKILDASVTDNNASRNPNGCALPYLPPIAQ